MFVVVDIPVTDQSAPTPRRPLASVHQGSLPWDRPPAGFAVVGTQRTDDLGQPVLLTADATPPGIRLLSIGPHDIGFRG